MSDEVAQQLEDGDACAAAQTALRLRDTLTEAINGGKVPEVYLEDLSGVVNEIEAQIPRCVNPAPPPESDEGEDEDRGKGKKKGKEKKKDKKGEDGPAATGTLTAETSTLPDTTTETTDTTVTDTTTTTTTVPGDDG